MSPVLNHDAMLSEELIVSEPRLVLIDLGLRCKLVTFSIIGVGLAAAPVMLLVELVLDDRSMDLSSAIEDSSGADTSFTGPVIGAPVMKGCVIRRSQVGRSATFTSKQLEMKLLRSSGRSSGIGGPSPCPTFQSTPWTSNSPKGGFPMAISNTVQPRLHMSAIKL